MPTLKNTNPLGAVHIHKVGFVEAGAEFEVSDDLAASLLRQRGNYELVAPKSPAAPTTPAPKKG